MAHRDESKSNRCRQAQLQGGGGRMRVLLRPIAPPPEFGIGAQEFLAQPCAESGSHKNLEQETQLHTRLSRSGSSLSRLARPSLPPRAHACARLPSDPKKQAKLRPWPSSANLSMYVPPGLVGSLEIDFDVNPGRPRTPIRLAPGTARPRHSTRRFIPAPLHSQAGACLPVHLLRRRSTTTSPWEAERPTRSNAGPRIEETKSARRRGKGAPELQPSSTALSSSSPFLNWRRP